MGADSGAGSGIGDTTEARAVAEGLELIAGSDNA